MPVDARRRRKMLWFLGLWAAFAFIAALTYAIMVRLHPELRRVSPRQAIPRSTQP